MLMATNCNHASVVARSPDEFVWTAVTALWSLFILLFLGLAFLSPRKGPQGPSHQLWEASKDLVLCPQPLWRV